MYCLGMDKGLLPFYTRYLIPMLSLTTKDGLQDTLAISLPTVDKWKGKKERVCTLILPSRLPCLSRVSFTSASLREKFLRGDTDMWEGKTSSHSLA